MSFIKKANHKCGLQLQCSKCHTLPDIEFQLHKYGPTWCENCGFPRASCPHQYNRNNDTEVRGGVAYGWFLDQENNKMCHQEKICTLCGHKILIFSSEHKFTGIMCRYCGFKDLTQCKHDLVLQCNHRLLQTSPLNYWPSWNDNTSCCQIFKCSTCYTLIQTPSIAHEFKYDDKGKATCVQCGSLSTSHCRDGSHKMKPKTSPEGYRFIPKTTRCACCKKNVLVADMKTSCAP